MNLYTDVLETSIGAIQLVATEQAVVLLDFADNTERIQKLLVKRFGTFTLEPRALVWTKTVEAYFAGQLEALHSIPTDTGGTDFQQTVWQALLKIPIGQTWSYLDMAKYIGQPSATRAVGMTNGLNPISLILPCHRVIGSNGKLTGYAGGLERKKWLLEHESGFFQYLDSSQAASAGTVS
jgi:methylated-DNA-[protein]-cysteine S-methyltransferase